VRATVWAHFTAATCTPGGGVAFAVLVSRSFCFPIQMNFAENRKWPSSRRWRGRPADGVGESMRRGQSKRRAAPAKLLQRTRRRINRRKAAHQPRRRGTRPVHSAGGRTQIHHKYHIFKTTTRDLLYRLAGPETASLAIGSQWASTSTKPVAQASRRTGVARQQWEAPPPTAAGWVLWATGRWRVLPQSNRGQPRAADTAMVDAAR
jgi:hypothetical protein